MFLVGVRGSGEPEPGYPGDSNAALTGVSSDDLGMGRLVHQLFEYFGAFVQGPGLGAAGLTVAPVHLDYTAIPVWPTVVMDEFLDPGAEWLAGRAGAEETAKGETGGWVERSVGGRTKGELRR